MGHERCEFLDESAAAAFRTSEELANHISANGCSRCQAISEVIRDYIRQSSSRDSFVSEITLIDEEFKHRSSRDHLFLTIKVNTPGEEEESSRFVDLEVYTDAASDVRCGDIPAWDRSVQDMDGELTGSDSHLDFVREWLSNCKKSHPRCKITSPGDSPLPTRVIDIRPMRSGGNPVLFETQGVRAPYSCLSHCWGISQPLRTLKSNLESHKKGIPLGSLPKTFREAITVADYLGTSYIWIDSLCIIQDDAVDWEVEASRMGDVYGKYEITISSTASPGAETGLFATIPSGLGEQSITSRDVTIFYRKNHEDHDRLLGFKGSNEETAFTYSPVSTNSRYPLTTRAWTVQEHYLAPRVVQFGPSQIFVQCTSDYECSCGVKFPGEEILNRQAISDILNAREQRKAGNFTPVRNVRNKALRLIEDDELFETELLRRGHFFWRKFTSMYSNKLITKEKDRLPALSGIAKSFQKVIGSKYLAGLWEDSLPQDTCWYCMVPAKEPQEYQAPSWSWASISGSVGTQMDDGDHFEAQITVLRTHCETSLLDPTGSVLFGELEVSGKAIQASTQRYDPAIKRLWITSDIDLHFQPDVEPGVQGSLRSLRPKQNVLCLPTRIRAHTGYHILAQFLVLNKEEKYDGIRYRRVGFAELLDYKLEEKKDVYVRNAVSTGDGGSERLRGVKQLLSEIEETSYVLI